MRTRASASATVASGGQDHRLGRHHAAGGVLGVGEQPADVLGLVRLHQLQQLLRLLRRQLAEQVRRVVGRHRLEDVGRSLLREEAEDLDLVVLGQLLQDVRELLVVEGGRHLGSALGRQLVQHAGEVGRAELLERREQVRGALVLLADGEAADLGPVDGAASRPDGGSRPSVALRTCDLGRTQSRVRVCSIATSSTVTLSPVSTSCTRRSSSSPRTRVSAARRSKRRMLTTPVVMTWPGSTAVTRVMGRNIRRRIGTSTTRPFTRAGRSPVRRMDTTTSRMRPTWSPPGSKTVTPARRAMKTFDAPLTVRKASAPRPADRFAPRRAVGAAGQGRPGGSVGSPAWSAWSTTSSTCSPTRPSRGTRWPWSRAPTDWRPAQLQAIAREFHLSETAFPLDASVDEVAGGATYALRIFTPEAELPFAGHPSIGTAWLLAPAGPDRARDRRPSLRSGALPLDRVTRRRPGGARPAVRQPRDRRSTPAST